MQPTIMLQSGKYFDFKDPFNSDFTIQDIARALSRIPRFTGHTDRFLSVAQHSIHVALLVPGHLRMQGLFHDAHEAFVGDMPTPLKMLCPDYRAVEDHAASAVRERFGVPTVLDPRVKEADTIALATEKHLFMPADKEHWACIEGVALRCDVVEEAWSSKQAEDEFLHWFRELTAVPERFAKNQPLLAASYG